MAADLKNDGRGAASFKKGGGMAGEAAEISGILYAGRKTDVFQRRPTAGCENTQKRLEARGFTD